MLFWFLLFLTILVLYHWYSQTYDFWSSRGVPFKRPVPFFGNLLSVVLNRKCKYEVTEELYHKFKEAPLIGSFDFTKPTLIVKDPELLKHVFVKDFGVFMDRGLPLPTVECLMMNVLHMEGERWRNLRNKLSPVFTSGKMKGMIPQVQKCYVRLRQYLIKETEKGGPIEVKYPISGFAMEVLSCCMLGMECNAIEDANSSFRIIGEKMFAATKSVLIYGELSKKFPRLLKLYNKICMNEPFNFDEFMTNLVVNTIRHREENNVVREDFIKLMMDLREQENNRPPRPNEVKMDDRVITSNSFVFLLAGYETTASTISFMLYELAVNQLIQERLYREIKEVLNKHSNELTWDTLKDLQYLEQVTIETLRKYPPGTELRRSCGNAYKFPNTNVEIPAGTAISIPIYSLHHDPQYYKNPEMFDPERFSVENMKNITNFTWIPFGDGPRICIGLRFAKMEIKMAVARLIADFSIKLNSKTISPLRFDPGNFLLCPIGGIWLDFCLRKNDILISGS